MEKNSAQLKQELITHMCRNLTCILQETRVGAAIGYRM